MQQATLDVCGRDYGCSLDYDRLFMLPSGKHTKNYGKSPLLIGKSTINGLFSIVMLVYQRVIGYKWI